MAKFTKESLEQLKTRIDLPQVLQSHMELKRAGAAWKGLCPFHDERTPSFVVNNGDRHYHCFGCGAHGDAIQFLMQHMRLGFYEAVEQLAERFSVTLEKTEGEEDRGPSKPRMKEANLLASRFYQLYLLESEEGREALQYLFQRGFTLQFLQTFGVGLAPKHEGALLALLKAHGYDAELLEKSGLFRNQNGRLREFFQERITFPILDPQGAVIGFSARSYREGTYGGKYINTVETDLFKKSRVLFGLHYSRKRIAKERVAIIVEGQLDALRLIYNGFDCTVAALGTAFGEQHARELIQLGVSKVYLLFDGDTAGGTAAVKVGDIFQKEGVEVLVGKFEEDNDPDSLLLKEGPQAIQRVILRAENYLLFLYRHFSKSIKLDSPAEKNQLLKDITTRIREWNNPVMVHESIKKLANLAKVPEELLGGSGRVIPQFARSKPATKEREGVDPDRILEGDLLRWLLTCGAAKTSLFELLAKNLNEEAFRNEEAKKLFQHLMQERGSFEFLSLAALDDATQHFVTEILARKVNAERAETLFPETIQKIKERNWLDARERLMMQIQSGVLSEAEITDVVRAFDALKREQPKVLV